MESILGSIRKLVGPDEVYTHFDPDLIMHINAALAVLTQLGVGPKEGFAITDDTATWSDFLGDNPKLNFIKTYVYMKVKLVFDPPTNSSVLEAMQQWVKEFEWRGNVEADTVEDSE